jgi:hypothetical protein
VAAVEPVGDSALVWRAAEQLGIAANLAALTAAEELVRFGARVQFRHPLVHRKVIAEARSCAVPTRPRGWKPLKLWSVSSIFSGGTKAS